MSLNKHRDLKGHDSRRTQSLIHPIPSASHPNAADFLGVELAHAEPVTGNPVEGALKQSLAREFESLRNLTDSDSCHVIPPAVSESVQM